jgi:hypothetical protein
MAETSLILADEGACPSWANAGPLPPKIRETRTRVEIVIFRNLRVNMVFLLVCECGEDFRHLGFFINSIHSVRFRVVSFLLRNNLSFVMIDWLRFVIKKLK